MPVNDFTLHGFVREPDGRGNGYNSRKSVARAQRLIDIALGASACAGRAMDEQETGKQDSGKQEASYDYHRYKQLLAEAVDKTWRWCRQLRRMRLARQSTSTSGVRSRRATSSSR